MTSPDTRRVNLHQRLTSIRDALSDGWSPDSDGNSEVPGDLARAAFFWKKIDVLLEGRQPPEPLECCALVAQCTEALMARRGGLRAHLDAVRRGIPFSVESALETLGGLNEDRFYIGCLLVLDAASAKTGTVEQGIAEMVAAAVEVHVCRGLRTTVETGFEEHVYVKTPFSAAERMIQRLVDTGGHRLARLQRLHPEAALARLFTSDGATEELAEVVAGHLGEDALAGAIGRVPSGEGLDAGLWCLVPVLAREGRMREAEELVFQIGQERVREGAACRIIAGTGAPLPPPFLEKLVGCVGGELLARVYWVRGFTAWACFQGLLEEAEKEIMKLWGQLGFIPRPREAGDRQEVPKFSGRQEYEIYRVFTDTIAFLIRGSIWNRDWRRALRMAAWQPGPFLKHIGFLQILHDLCPQVERRERLEFVRETAEMLGGLEDPETRQAVRTGLLRLLGAIGTEEAWEYALDWIREHHDFDSEGVQRQLIDSVRKDRLMAVAFLGDWQLVKSLHQDLESELPHSETLTLALLAAGDGQRELCEAFLERYGEIERSGDVPEHELERLDFINEIKAFQDSVPDYDLSEASGWFAEFFERARDNSTTVLFVLGRMLIAAPDFHGRHLLFHRTLRAIWRQKRSSLELVYLDALRELAKLAEWRPGNAELSESPEHLPEEESPPDGSSRKGFDPAEAGERLLLSLETEDRNYGLEMSLLFWAAGRVCNELSESERELLFSYLEKNLRAGSTPGLLSRLKETCRRTTSPEPAEEDFLYHQTRHYPMESALDIAQEEPGSLELMRVAEILLDRAQKPGQESFMPRVMDLAQKVLDRSRRCLPDWVVDILSKWISTVGRVPDCAARRVYLNQMWDWLVEFEQEDLRLLKSVWIAEMITAGGDAVGEERLEEFKDEFCRMECLFRIAFRLGISGEDPRAREFLMRYDAVFERLAADPQPAPFPASSLRFPAEKLAELGDAERLRKILQLGRKAVVQSNTQNFIFELAWGLFRPGIKLGLMAETLELLGEISSNHGGYWGISWNMASFLAFDPEARMERFSSAQRVNLLEVFNPLLDSEERCSAAGQALGLLAALTDSPDALQILRDFRTKSPRPEQIAESVSKYLGEGKVHPRLMVQLSTLAPYSFTFAKALLVGIVLTSPEKTGWNQVKEILSMLPAPEFDFYKDLAAGVMCITGREESPALSEMETPAGQAAREAK